MWRWSNGNHHGISIGRLPVNFPTSHPSAGFDQLPKTNAVMISLTKETRDKEMTNEEPRGALSGDCRMQD